MDYPTAERSFHTYREIVTQADAWRATLSELAPRADEVKRYLSDHNQLEVLCTGCGSPYYLALSVAPMFQELADISARALPASELMLFPKIGLAPARPRLLIALSRSGATTELLQAVKGFAASGQGAALGITCYDNTPLAAATALTFVVPEAREQSLAQTRAFTSMLLAAQLVSYAVAGRTPSKRFHRLPDDCAALFETYHGLARELGEDGTLERFFFLGSGHYYGLACEAMLKMKEMSLSYSEAYHCLELRHGPMSMVNKSSLVVGMLSQAGLAHEVAVLQEMRQLGARVLAITPLELGADQADYQIVLPPGLNDIERAALYLPLLQLMTFYRALHNQLNPDQPANLNYVVQLDIDGITDRLAGSVRQPTL